ncbi:hypothetical protein [Anaerolinea sp.]|uniref:hypothetical protein n=1 Tax=Anaerolinea sp. TaxID=1872519 RepID=UPI002ACEB463|nr:hypothetical protein [Anaerolinea sp.]
MENELVPKNGRFMGGAAADRASSASGTAGKGAEPCAVGCARECEAWVSLS